MLFEHTWEAFPCLFHFNFLPETMSAISFLLRLLIKLSEAISRCSSVRHIKYELKCFRFLWFWQCKKGEQCEMRRGGQLFHFYFCNRQCSSQLFVHFSVLESSWSDNVFRFIGVLSLVEHFFVIASKKSSIQSSALWSAIKITLRVCWCVQLYDTTGSRNWTRKSISDIIGWWMFYAIIAIYLRERHTITGRQTLPMPPSKKGQLSKLIFMFVLKCKHR